MPEYGLIGDSSLCCKSSKKRVKRIGCQLQEELATNDLWYHAVANAGVEKILQMLADTRLKFGTLGISYFGNDIMYGKIRPQVRCTAYHAKVIDRLQTCVEGGIEFEGSLSTLRFVRFHTTCYQVRAAWKDLIDLVEEKADRVVFVVGGSSKCLRPQADRWEAEGAMRVCLRLVTACGCVGVGVQCWMRFWNSAEERS